MMDIITSLYAILVAVQGWIGRVFGRSAQVAGLLLIAATAATLLNFGVAAAALIAVASVALLCGMFSAAVWIGLAGLIALTHPITGLVVVVCLSTLGYYAERAYVFAKAKTIAGYLTCHRQARYAFLVCRYQARRGLRAVRARWEDLGHRVQILWARTFPSRPEVAAATSCTLDPGPGARKLHRRQPGNRRAQMPSERRLVRRRVAIG